MVDQNYTFRTTTPAELQACEIEAWEQLSINVPYLRSPFLSVHYASAVAASGMDVRICILYRDNVICGFLPYQYRSRFSAWSRSAERVGGEMTDYFGLIANPDLNITQSSLLKHANINYLSFSHLDERQLHYGLSGEQPRIGLRILLNSELESPISGINSVDKKYLQNSEKRQRKLIEEIGPIKFDFDVQQNRQELLEMLIHQKRIQYNKTRTPDALREQWKRTLLCKLSEYRHGTCRGILSTMYAGDQWVAMHFGIFGNGVLHLWFPVYNPEVAMYAPGRLLLHHIIQSTRKYLIHTIDRGEGDTPRKRELENQQYLLYRGEWTNKSAASQITKGIQCLKWRLGI